MHKKLDSKFPELLFCLAKFICTNWVYLHKRKLRNSVIFKLTIYEFFDGHNYLGILFLR